MDTNTRLTLTFANLIKPPSRAWRVADRVAITAQAVLDVYWSMRIRTIEHVLRRTALTDI